MNHHQENKGKLSGGECPYIKYQVITSLTLISLILHVICLSWLSALGHIITIYHWTYIDLNLLIRLKEKDLPFFGFTSLDLSSLSITSLAFPNNNKKCSVTTEFTVLLLRIRAVSLSHLEITPVSSKEWWEQQSSAVLWSTEGGVSRPDSRAEWAIYCPCDIELVIQTLCLSLSPCAKSEWLSIGLQKIHVKEAEQHLTLSKHSITLA